MFNKNQIKYQFTNFDETKNSSIRYKLTDKMLGQGDKPCCPF